MNDDKYQKQKRRSSNVAEHGTGRAKSQPTHERQKTAVGGLHCNRQALLQKIARLLGRQAARDLVAETTVATSNEISVQNPNSISNSGGILLPGDK